mmetsp:Transcript_29873/g.45667  ORF Transcript_29873/g.45667 Transcript_29873/m.45667 type:complete len:147 (+) Transcript_29873:1847-2287(+)
MQPQKRPDFAPFVKHGEEEEEALSPNVDALYKSLNKSLNRQPSSHSINNGYTTSAIFIPHSDDGNSDIPNKGRAMSQQKKSLSQLQPPQRAFSQKDRLGEGHSPQLQPGNQSKFLKNFSGLMAETKDNYGFQPRKIRPRLSTISSD